MESADTPDPMLGKRPLWKPEAGYPMLGKRPPWKPEALQRERERESDTRDDDTRGLGREPGKSSRLSF